MCPLVQMARGKAVACIVLACLSMLAVATSEHLSEGGAGRSLLYDLPGFRACALKVTGLQVVYKGDSAYEQHRKRISNPKFLSLKYPAAFGFPSTANQASRLLKCAKQSGMVVAARGGGHNYEGLSLVNGLVIDTSKMTSIKFGKRNGKDVVTVGPGQRIGPVNAQLWSNQFFVPTGVCDSVGIAGVVLGGGIGPNLRKLGLAADSLVEAEIVTASGKVLKANSVNNTDLYFAVRGGGGNFGLVTSLTLTARRPPPKVSVLQVSWDPSLNNMRSVVKAFFKWQPHSLPDEYSYVELFLGASLRLVVYYWGPQQDLKKLYDTNAIFQAGSGKNLERLREFDYGGFLEYMMNPWNVVPLSQMTLSNVINRAYDSNGGRPEYKASSSFLKTELSSADVDKLTSTIYNKRDKNAWVQIHAMGGAVNRVGVTATAFPHRNTKYQMQIYIYDYMGEAWIRSVQSALKPASTGLQYLNYIDTDTVNPWGTYFGANAQRLQSIKQKWDAGNVFDALNQR